MVNDTLACAALKIWTEQYENYFNIANYCVHESLRGCRRKRVLNGKRRGMRNPLLATAAGCEISKRKFHRVINGHARQARFGFNPNPKIQTSDNATYRCARAKSIRANYASS
jgi:hypothetical protein